MKLKGIEVDFSFTDADCIERLENAAKKVKEKSELKNKEEKSLSETIREECKIIDEFVDEVFGKRISEKIFKGKKDLQEHMELFTDIINAKIATTKDTQNLYDTLENRAKYMPNRETRRYNKYNKGRK
nr:MAG TPA: hypothetical protein [Bacteriophage sp.]DAW32510.1 MAG TPA: tail assembly chaperone protein [Caudoviricetes sp.]